MLSLHQTLDLAWQACRELDTCVTFVEVLQYVLAIGNYLNADSRQGGAYGFKLSVLPKVGEYFVLRLVFGNGCTCEYSW